MTVRPIALEHLTPEMVARFWLKTVSGDNGCIEWVGARTPTGYGKFSLGRRRYNAHRFAFIATFGETDLEIDHLCRNRGCVAVAHLEAVSRVVNVRRAMKDTCPQGHPYTGDNTYFERGRLGQSDTRRCRTCRTARSRASYQSRKVA